MRRADTNARRRRESSNDRSQSPEGRIVLAHFIVSDDIERARRSIRDPDGHLIEVGQTTTPTKDWAPRRWAPTHSLGVEPE